MVEDRLSRFEDHIQRLIEGGFARLFAGRLHPREVAARLARAMEDHAIEDEDGRLTAPDVYVVRLHTQDYEAILEEQPELAEALAAELVEMARAAGLTLARFPEVRLLVDDTMQPNGVAIGALHTHPSRDTTQGLPLVEAPPLPEALHAMLIVGGDQHIPLRQPILNLGRHRDNHVIIDDARVSRHHAQIRLRAGHYVLFDLGSSGGTTVNERPVQEVILRSGDVIALAGNTLIYVDDRADDEPEEGTKPHTPPETLSDEV